MMGEQDYSARRAARIARLEQGAAKMRAQADEQLRHVDQLAEQRPLGQPILLGHHSENSARRHQARIELGMRRGVALLERAEELQRQATAAEDNEAISSDDPNAIERLQAKLAAVESWRERWKSISKALRSRDATAIEGLALTAEERRRVAASGGHIGYVTTNASAEIRRIQLRLKQLKRRSEREPRPAETIGEVVIDEDQNRVRIRFPSRPALNVVQELKRRGFRWSPSSGAWQRYPSDDAWRKARTIAELALGAP